MGFSLAALLVVLVHLAYVVFTLVGGFMAWRWPKALRLHLPAVGVAALLAVTGWECPLTDLEKWFRRRAGESPYPGGFISHYLVEPLVPGGISGQLRVGIRATVIVMTTVAYVGCLARRRARTGLWARPARAS